MNTCPLLIPIVSRFIIDQEVLFRSLIALKIEVIFTRISLKKEDLKSICQILFVIDRNTSTKQPQPFTPYIFLSLRTYRLALARVGVAISSTVTHIKLYLIFISLYNFPKHNWTRLLHYFVPLSGRKGGTIFTNC